MPGWLRQAPLGLGLLVLVAGAAQATGTVEQRVWVAGEGSEVRYVAQHPFQEVVGVSRAPNLRLRWSPDDPAALDALIGEAVEISWQSFDSGNANRDAVVLERVRGYRWPSIYGVFDGFSEVVTASGELRVLADMRWYIGGVRRPLAVPLRVSWARPGEVRVEASVELRMSEFEIDPPQLLFLSASDRLRVEVDLRLVALDPAPRLRPAEAAPGEVEANPR